MIAKPVPTFRHLRNPQLGSEIKISVEKPLPRLPVDWFTSGRADSQKWENSGAQTSQRSKRRGGTANFR